VIKIERISTQVSERESEVKNEKEGVKNCQGIREGIER